MLTRRRLLAGTLAALAVPLATEEQQPGSPRRIALVFASSPVSTMAGPDPSHPYARAVIHALRELGWIEGQNVIIERRSAEEHRERFGAIIRELVEMKCEVIITTGNEMAHEAKRITTSVPIVMNGIGNPVSAGLVASFARPGGNLTGRADDLGVEFEVKRLTLLKDALPSVTTVAIVQSRATWDTYGQTQRTAAQALGLMLIEVDSGPRDSTSSNATLENGLAVLDHRRPGVLVVGPGNFLFAARQRLLDYASRKRLPLIGLTREFTEQGGLMSYSPSRIEFARTTAKFVDRILKGAKPGDLPIERPTIFELVVNLKTAKALGLTIPPTLLARADQVIE